MKMDVNRMSLKRPSGKEDEDEILKMQEEFLSSKGSPSAKVQRVVRNAKESSSNEKKKTTPSKNKPAEDASSKIVDFTDYTTDVPVLLAISEKNIDYENIQAPTKKATSFPRPFKLDDSTPLTKQVHGSGTKRGPSLFAQQMRKKAGCNSLPIHMESSTVKTCPVSDTGQSSGKDVSHSLPANSSFIEIKDIQQENDAQIAAMSIEEIKQYQQQLKNQLGPDLVKLIKSRKKNNPISTEEHGPMEVEQKQPQCDLSTKVAFEQSKEVDNPVTKENEIPPDLILPIAPEEAKKWPHMDRIEYEKLAWMSKLPHPKPVDPKTNHTARFDFQGFLLSRDEDIPVQQGLHHHGEEPEVPGYTIEEMFHLSRSSLSSQRIIALQTLARVLHNSNLGVFDECLNTQLLPQLLDAGVIFLLRLALDESQLDAVGAAIYALHGLLVSELDEACLDSMFSWHFGHISPFMVSEVKSKMPEEEEKEMPDSEIVKEDVIMGLLRMDILPRLRYILQIMKPDDKTIVKHILEILTRLSRHSIQASCQILDYPNLLKTVFENFIPIHWTLHDNKSDNTYGVPLPSALKLVRCLASAGRHLSKRLVHDFKLGSLLNAYIASDSSDSISSLVRLEALRTWKILLSYGLASETWIDLYPVLMKHYQHCQGLSLTSGTHSVDLHYAALLLSSLQGVVVLAGSQTKQSLSRVVYWNHVENIYSLVSCLVQKWIRELIVSGFADVTIGISTLTAAINHLVGFLQMEMLQPNANVTEICDRISDLWTRSIQPLMESTELSHLATNLELHSTLLSSSKPGTDRSPENLPFLGAAQFGGREMSPAVKEGSVLPLLVALLGFARLVSQKHCLTQQSLDLIIKTFSCYAKAVVSCKHLRQTWFTKQEVFLLHHLVHLVTTKVEDDKSNEENVMLYHQVALLLPAITSHTEGYLVEELFTSVLFHPVFYSDESKLCAEMMTLQTGEVKGLISVTGQTLEISENRILKDTFASLMSIRDLYLHHVHLLPKLSNSKFIFKAEYGNIQAMSMEWEAQKGTFSMDWPLLPLQVVYNQRNKKCSELENDQYCFVSTLKACLHWIHYLMLARSDFFKSSVEVGELFVWLCSVFLMSDDLFLNEQVQVVLYCLLRKFFMKHKKEHLKLETIKKPVAFLTFFQELAGHFESTSYGDSLFASVILIPLQQKYSYIYKQLFLTEHSSALRLITLPLTQMLVPIDEYLYPLEEHLPLLQMYLKFLQIGHFVKCPVLQTIAVHHLHHYIFSENQKESCKLFIEQILKSRNQECVLPILLYKGVDLENGVITEEKLPVQRRDFLNSLGFTNITI